MKTVIKFKMISNVNFDNDINKTTVYVDCADLPQDIPLDCNPRKQRMNTSLVTSMKKSLVEEKGVFHLLNRGITILAESVKIDKNKVEVNFSDLSVHGCIDGGHTYRAICNMIEKGLISKGMNMVTIEIYYGNGLEGKHVLMAATRNSSQQIKNSSLTEIDKGFDWIKRLIKNEVYAADIIYKENDIGRIKIDQIIWLMAAVNPVVYDTGRYSSYIRHGKAMSLYMKEYKTKGFGIKNPFYVMKNLLIDLISLYDYIQTNFGKEYKNFSKLKPVRIANYKSEFFRNDLKYHIPNQWFYPVVSSIRAIIEMDDKTGFFKWKQDPFKWVEKALPKMVMLQVKTYQKATLEECRNSNALQMLYETSDRVAIEIELNDLKISIANNKETD